MCVCVHVHMCVCVCACVCVCVYVCVCMHACTHAHLSVCVFFVSLKGRYLLIHMKMWMLQEKQLIYLCYVPRSISGCLLLCFQLLIVSLYLIQSRLVVPSEDCLYCVLSFVSLFSQK